MEVGHIFKIDDKEYCICAIVDYNGQKVAYTTTGQLEETEPVFFELIDDENGTGIIEIIDDNIISDILEILANE